MPKKLISSEILTYNFLTHFWSGTLGTRQIVLAGNCSHKDIAIIGIFSSINQILNSSGENFLGVSKSGRRGLMSRSQFIKRNTHGDNIGN